MVPRENKNNVYAKFGGQTKSIMVFSEVAYKEDICLQTLLLLFKCANHRKKRPFVSTNNEALFGILMTIGNVNDIFPVGKRVTY